MTFGLGIVYVETVRFFFGSMSQTVPPPAPLVGITPLGFMFYPTYRLALLGIVAVALLALYFTLYRTRIGMIVRAGIEDSVMVNSLGIDVYKIFMLVFGIGAMAAGFAGIVNAPVVSIAPDVGESIMVQTFVVVVIGGVGSFPAPFSAASSPARSSASRRCSIPAIPTSCSSSQTLVLVFAVTNCSVRPAANEQARLMRGQRSFLLEALTAIGLIAAPFILPYLDFTPTTMSRILVWGLFGIGFDVLFRFAECSPSANLLFMAPAAWWPRICSPSLIFSTS